METTEKINIRRAINELEINGIPLKLPKSDYVPSSVRSTAASIKGDNGKRFSVSVNNDTIIVKRIS